VQAHWQHGPTDPVAFALTFFSLVGGPANAPRPDPVPPQFEQNARLLQQVRGFWEADVPLGILRDAPFPKLVVNGDQSPPYFATICDALTAALGAQRLTVPGANHAVQWVGAAFYEPLEAFLLSAATTAPAA
jgi:hypothetical protein